MESMTPSSGNELLECPICCELFNNATETFCGHAFCEYCIARCLEHEPDVCPVCRNDPSPIHPSFTLRRVVEEWRKLRGLPLEDEDKKSASEEKQTGNNHYLKGEFADAIKHYTNAIEESPSAILYGNRATAFFKLNQWKLALFDCDKAIKMDATYVKAYLRKGLCLEQLKDYNGAYQTFNEVKRLDKNGQLREETEQGIKRVYQLASLQSSINNTTQTQQQQQPQAPPPPQQTYPNRPTAPTNSSYPYGQQPSQPNYSNNNNRNSQAYRPPYEQYPGQRQNVQSYPAAVRPRRETRNDCIVQ